MKVTNLYDVKKYTAGKNGHLLVSMDEDCNICNVHCNGGLFGNTPKDYKIHAHATTVILKNPRDVDILEAYCDDATPACFVIVVGSTFQWLTNKSQLILLERENTIAANIMCRMLDGDDLHNISFRGMMAEGELRAMEKFGALRAAWTFNREHKRIMADEIHAGINLHRQYQRVHRGENIAKLFSGQGFAGLFGQQQQQPQPQVESDDMDADFIEFMHESD